MLLYVTDFFFLPHLHLLFFLLSVILWIATVCVFCFSSSFITIISISYKVITNYQVVSIHLFYHDIHSRSCKLICSKFLDNLWSELIYHLKNWLKLLSNIIRCMKSFELNCKWYWIYSVGNAIISICFSKNQWKINFLFRNMNLFWHLHREWSIRKFVCEPSPFQKINATRCSCRWSCIQAMLLTTLFHS